MIDNDRELPEIAKNSGDSIARTSFDTVEERG